MGTHSTASASGLDLSQFDSDALEQAPEIIDCILSDGTETQCGSFTVSYKPDGLETGPFCPQTLDDVGGIWNWDGENAGLYRVDGTFLRMLNDLGFRFYDDEGNVNIVDLRQGNPDVDHACLAVSEDNTVTMTVLIPMNPVAADAPTQLGTVAEVGLALDGVPIFADAPSVLDRAHMPALDPCGGHVDPGGWYHWHATSTDIDTVYQHANVEAECVLEQSSTAQFAYAFDGFPMFGSMEFDGSTPSDLDECSGHLAPTANEPDGEYHYHSTTEFPNLPTCLKGLQANNNFSTTAEQGIGSKRAQDGQRGGGRNGPPGLEEAAEKLGIEPSVLLDVLSKAGGPDANMADVAATLGISEQSLREAMPARR